ncbi:hypothetical protein D3C80_1346290 [compost metagenome]
MKGHFHSVCRIQQPLQQLLIYGTVLAEHPCDQRKTADGPEMTDIPQHHGSVLRVIAKGTRMRPHHHPHRNGNSFPHGFSQPQARRQAALKNPRNQLNPVSTVAFGGNRIIHRCGNNL